MSSTVYTRVLEDSGSPQKENVFWYHSLSSNPPLNFTPGLIPVLKQALQKSHGKGQTVRAALCYDKAVHVSVESWDSRWGCGYRNFLMACTALINQEIQPTYFPALTHPTPPGIRNLQQWIEDAWEAGFDKEGADDLKHKLVGTRKWIGTAELCVAFTTRGIPCQLVDFPKVNSGANAVLAWVENYFSSPYPNGKSMGTPSPKRQVQTTIGEALRGATPIVVTDRMPIILQHDGHSRTIVGYERLKNGSVNLLCFDPSRFPKKDIRNAGKANYFANKSTSPTTEKRPHLSVLSSRVPKFLSKVLHTKHKKNIPGDDKKRTAGSIDEERDMKRVRGGSPPSNGANTGGITEVIEISDEDEENNVTDSPKTVKPGVSSSTIPNVEYTEVLEFFRLKPRKVGQKDQYQILYFPLEELLTEQERWDRRVVSSEVIR